MWQIVKCHGGLWAPAASRRCWGRVVASGVFPAIPSRPPTLLSLPQTVSCQYLTSQSIGLFAILTSLLWQFVGEKHDSTLLEVVVVAGVLGRLGSYLATATSRHLVSHGGRQSLAAWRHCSRDPPHHLLNLPFICRLDPDLLILDIALPLLGYLCSRNYMKLFQIEARTLDMKGHFGEKERCA